MVQRLSNDILESDQKEEMMRRCDAIGSCTKIVNEKNHSHVRLGERVFCSADCAQSWLLQSRIFEVATDPFHKQTNSAKQRKDG